MDHFTYAVKKSIENTSQSLGNPYQKAIITSKGPSHFEDVLAACALADLDDYNCFTNSNTLPHFKDRKREKSTMTTKDFRYYLDALCKEDKGLILEKVGLSSNIRYKFRNPMMRAFIRLKIHDKRVEANRSLPLLEGLD